MKKFIIAALLIIMSISLAACSMNKQSSIHKRDYVEVYDAKEKKVATITKRASVGKISDYGSEVDSTIKVKSLKNAEISYHYVLHQIKPKYKIHLYVYSNSNYVKMTNIPLIGKVAFKIPAKQAAQLNHPQDFK